MSYSRTRQGLTLLLACAPYVIYTLGGLYGCCREHKTTVSIQHENHHIPGGLDQLVS